MNILFFDSIDKDIFGGVETWIGMVAGQLAREGHNVTVAGRPGSEYLRRMAALDEKINIRPVNISGDFDPFTIARIRRFLKEHKIDIVTVNFNKDIRLAGLAARWYGRTRVVWRVGINLTKDNIVHRFLTPRLVDGVITPSSSLKREITALGYITPEMVEVIPNGTAVKNFPRPNEEARRKLREKYGLPPQAVIAVTVGRFVNHKGHTYLIDAAQAVVEKHPQIVFMFLGDGYQMEKHREHIAQLDLKDHFVFAGMLDDMDLELGGADLMVHPSIIEPFGIALLDGMRAGLPIVATRVGGIPEVVNDEHAILIEPGDSGQIANAVNSLLDSTSRRDTFSRAAQKRWRENFTIDIMLNKVESYFSSVVLGKDERKPV